MPLTGQVHYPGDPHWEQARRPYNNRFAGAAPRAIVFCGTTQDVQNAVCFANEQGFRLRVRCGRHDYEGWSSCSDAAPGEDWLIIDVSQMEGLEYVRDDWPSPGPVREVVAEAGLEMNLLAELLADAGVALPLATGPSVGLAGLTLAGGFGPTSRKFGLTCDNLLEVEMVDFRGQLIKASATENAELFWACRGGGGGSFGICTRFRFQVHPVDRVAWFVMAWEWRHFEKVVDTWQRWLSDLDPRLSTMLRLQSGNGPDERRIFLSGLFCPDPPGGEEAPQLQPMLRPLSQLPLAGMILDYGLYIEAARWFMGGSRRRPAWLIQEHHDYERYKATSAYARGWLDAEGLKVLRHQVEAAPRLRGVPRPEPGLRRDVPTQHMVQLLSGGGACATPDRTATAMWYRQAPFLLQYDGYWSADEDAEPTMQWVRETREQLLPWSEGAYVGYLDRNLQLSDYFGGNLERLQAVKTRFDPDNVFAHGQSIPPG